MLCNYDVLSRQVEPRIIDYKTTFNRDFVDKYNLPNIGPPTRIVVHRTGNARATGLSNCHYFWNSGRALSHVVIEGTKVYKLVEPDILTWHVNSPVSRAKVEDMGFPISNPKWHKQRGDFNAYGIETDEDYSPTGEKIWTEDTYLTLITLLADIVSGKYSSMPNLTVADIYGHSEFDNVNRPEDPDGIVTPDRIREDVVKLLDSREKLDSSEIKRIIGNVRPKPTPESTDVERALNSLEKRITNLEAITRSSANAFLSHRHSEVREGLPSWNNEDDNAKGNAG